MKTAPSTPKIPRPQTAPEPRATPLKSKLSQRVVDLPPSGIRKFFDYAMGMEDIISLGVGEPDFSSPWSIREAAIFSLERGRTSYTSNRGYAPLLRGIAQYLERRWGLAYHPETELMITVGVSQGIDLALRAILNPGDEVIILEPCYVSYKPMVFLAGATPVVLPTFARDDFAPDFTRLEKLINPQTKAVFINYPNNPTGATLREADLRRLVRLAEQYDLLILSDEVYAELNYGEIPHVALPTLPGARARTIFLSGFSKAFAMTGWRIGYIAAPREIVDATVKIHQYSMLCAPIMSQMAALEALKSGFGPLEQMREAYLQRRNLIVRGLNDLGLACNLPHGAFYAFPSIASAGISAEDFAWRLLEQHHVALVPGSAFGECGAGHVRCSYATALKQIERALERIGRLLKNL